MNPILVLSLIHILAAVMLVSLAFSACSDEESGKADRAYKPIEIFGNIDEVLDLSLIHI